VNPLGFFLILVVFTKGVTIFYLYSLSLNMANFQAPLLCVFGAEEDGERKEGRGEKNWERVQSNNKLKFYTFLHQI
tara:strand:+ start:817 stop:1044 length:228 start_codon:yes stop_codon:yes gene_type:complete